MERNRQDEAAVRHNGKKTGKAKATARHNGKKHKGKVTASCSVKKHTIQK